MKNRNLLGAALAAALLAGAPATAGVYTDDLSKCLVKSTSESDRSDLVKFIFVALAGYPSIKDLTSVTAAQRAGFTLRYVAIFERMLFVDCRKEAVDAVKFEGTGALEQSSVVLGETAMRQLMSGPGFAAVTSDVAAHLDKGKWVALFREAGVSVDAAGSAPPAK
jgi:hypothetical protein